MKMTFLIRVIFMATALLYVSLSAETGMGLVITTTNGGSIGVDFQGTIRRIDIKDNQIINTTGSLGTGRFVRFSPDGTKFAYIKMDKTVAISDLEGRVIKRFDADELGQLSYTDAGIYIASSRSNKLYLYSESGNKISEQSVPQSESGFVSQNGKLLAGVATVNRNTDPFTVDMTTGKLLWMSGSRIWDCAVCPSPDGLKITQNNGGGTRHNGVSYGSHKSMAILNRDGTMDRFIPAVNITNSSTYNINRQCWSGNSNEWIVVPAGRGAKQQLEYLCEPWIYNYKTKIAICLSKRSNDFWQPHDYYSGKLP